MLISSENILDSISFGAADLIIARSGYISSISILKKVPGSGRTEEETRIFRKNLQKLIFDLEIPNIADLRDGKKIKVDRNTLGPQLTSLLTTEELKWKRCL